jgi:hypothetical protein
MPLAAIRRWNPHAVAVEPIATIYGAEPTIIPLTTGHLLIPQYCESCALYQSGRPFLTSQYVLSIAAKAWSALMSNETESKTSLQPVLSTHDLNDDLAGANVLALLQRAADVAEGNSRYALDVAKDLSRRLIASQARVAELEGRLAELEVEVQVHRDRSDQAEQWLNKISSELQGRIAGKP